MRNPNCKDCSLHKGVKTVCLWGDGPPSCDLMIIGRDPGANEDVLGRPFVGKAGAMLNQLLAGGQIDRSKVYITNIVRCRPPENRQPNFDEKAACLKYLKEEIAQVKPKMIITLGSDALETVTGQTTVMKLAGSVINVTKGDLDWEGKVYVTVHPSYLLRNANYVPRAKKHFTDIGYYYRGQEPPKAKTKYILVTKWEQVDKLFETMNEQKLIAFDTETSSLDFMHGKLLCFSFSWKERSAVVLPLVGYKQTEIWTLEQENIILSKLKEVFANEKIAWIAQNISFDHKYILKYGIDIAGVLHDTMLLQHLLDENAKDLKGLKAMAAAYTDMGRYDDPLDKCKKELRTAKSKALTEKRGALKRLIKTVSIVLTNAPDDDNAKEALEKLNTELTALSDVSIDISYDEIPTEILWPYAAMDADATFRIFNYHMKQLQIQSDYYAPYAAQNMSLSRIYHKLIMPLRRVLNEMEFVGARMDIDYLHSLDIKYSKRIAELTATLHEMPEIASVEKRLLVRNQKKAAEKWDTLKSVNDWLNYRKDPQAWAPDKRIPREPKFASAVAYGKHYGKSESFNLNSPMHLRIFLFDELGCSTGPNAKKTPTGELSTDEEVLIQYQDKHGVKLLVENRKLAKLHNTYVKGSLAKLIGTDRVHTNFNQHITVTGRLSSSNPNFQNIPREDKDIKRAFIPKDDWCIVQMDYAQAEFRMWCQLSGDKDMLADITAGLDIHKQTASDFWNIPMDQITKSQRSAAKFVVFGLMYGRGAASVAKQVGITEDEAEIIKKKFFNRYPRAAKWLQETRRCAVRDQFVSGFFGRVRRLPQAISPDRMKVAEAMRQAVNSPIQGSAADMTGIALVRIQKMLKETGLLKYGRPILTVHDSIIFEMTKDPEIRNDIINKCKTLMTQKLPGMIVPIDVDVEIGNNWADMAVAEVGI